jgi:Undecaprenyl-phosphate glucose phosphotransferase
MSRRKLAAMPGATAVDPASFASLQAPLVRIPDRIVLDLIALCEIVLVVAAAALAKVAYIVFVLDSPEGLEPYLVAGAAGGLLTHYMMRLRGLHEQAAIRDWRRRSRDVVVAIGLAFLALIAVAFLLKVSADYSRGWLLIWLALVSILLPVSRAASAALLSWLASTGRTSRRIAIVAGPMTGREIAQSIAGVPGIGIVGIFQDADGGTKVLPQRTLADLIAVGQRNQIDEVIVLISHIAQPRIAGLLDELSVLPVDVWLCASEINRPILGTARLGAVSLLQVKPRPIRDWGYLGKLGLDYLLGSIALALSAPLMLAVALAIKLDSPGPVLFRQRRHGYNHRVIDVYKFRTMTVTENGDRIEQARKNDPRVTRVGRFLRRTSLDELPQLFNVLKGEMSLVGPRPHALAHNQLYGERLQHYANRHCVKPGMTGWAQIHGLRGPTEDPEKMRQRVELDLHYIENWSLALDMKIIALTPFLGFIHRHAL